MEAAMLRKRKGKRQKKGSRQAIMPTYKNPWAFVDVLPELNEEMKLTKADLSKLECRLDYAIKCDVQVMFGSEQNDELFRIYGEQVGKDSLFMRNWVRLYVITNKKHIQKLASTYFQSIDSNLTTWMKDLKNGNKGDILALYVLSVITGVHCFIHLRQNKYWTSLKEVPDTHLEFMQQCNIHLAYFGQGTFIELKLRTTMVNYKLFGVDQLVQIKEKNPAVIGTLTCEEDITLDILLDQSKHLPRRLEKCAKPKMQQQISPKRIKRKLKTNTETLVKHNKGKTDLLTGSIPCTKTDIDQQTTTVHDDSDSTIIYDYQAEAGLLESKISSTCAMETETISDENQSKIYSANNKNEDIIEPQVNSSNNQNMKTVKIILQKLNTQDIMDLTRNKKTKIEQRRKEKPKCNTKNIYALAVLKKDTSGMTPKFTFSTYK